ncbi:class I tRNA ligase family protein [Nocardioides caldifontis]|uniref:class I tRNA ligase family protein n=1 Tax=Nocardioides caldifontis TaxID=2588938 RepID=UPI00193A7C1A|nr:class I tRNA ligase family protein [Nocardioides caldifontis]
MAAPGANPPPTSSGVVGVEGRYRLRERPAVPLVVAGRRLLPVGPLRMYTCGITPYDVTHVGHAATFVWADLVATLAHATGGEALVARNVTDVDDVLTTAARTRGRPYDELALTQEFLFDRDMRALSVATPALTPRARAHVAAVARLAAALLDVGAAYESEGFVYFRGGDLPAAAGLSEEAALTASQEYGDQAGVPGRESPFDVPVWRPSGESDPAWPSPWGWGRPGWHAECAAMAVSALGSTVDVLLGGVDLAFPHHAYQAAMVEAATGSAPFARTTVHVGEVRREGRKMAKSTGNLVLVSELLERYSGAALRLALLHRPWSEPWECEERVFEDAARLLAELDELAGGPGVHSERHDAVLEALAAELDVPRAVEVARAEGREAARYLMDVLKLRRL